ncbi:MAG: transglutaminase domain-containing protein, partial [Cellulosilyticaceae bacterium]
MLFTAKQALEIEKNLEEVKFRFVGKEKEFFGVLKDCSEEEKICMSYLYCFMPISDIADYDGNLILKFVRAALKAKALLSWGKDLSSECFLHYVAAYRVNNENIEDYRAQFFEELYPRVKDKTIKEAVIEANYWCLEKATYQSTDIRTASPLTVLKNAYGRCGEESTVLVSALRSIGIPARQCYAPRWAHCDDNHAWVEVWMENQWHYMGACEPEPRLDTGWFDWAASRAMLTEVKAFGTKMISEDVMDQSEIVSNMNTLEYYAQTKVITVEVKDTQEKPIKGATVRFELVNYAELYPIATQVTDHRGRASFKTGYGDLMLHIHKDGKFMMQKLDVREVDYIQIDWSNAQGYQVTNYEFDMVPPMVEVAEVQALPAEVESIHQMKMTEANEKRRAYELTFFNEKTASEFARNYKPYEQQIIAALIKARGNYTVIKTYIEQYEELPLSVKILLLEHLTKKDYTDISLEALVEHTKASLEYREQYEEEVFGKYILAPRIDLEMITPYKIQLLELLNQEAIERFREDPETIIAYIQREVKSVGEMDYPTLQAGPVGTLKLKRGSLVAKHILFVAICRTIGVPARIREIDGTIEYYQEG